MSLAKDLIKTVWVQGSLGRHRVFLFFLYAAAIADCPDTFPDHKWFMLSQKLKIFVLDFLYITLVILQIVSSHVFPNKMLFVNLYIMK